MSAGLFRGWINQPSTLQPLHHMHGTNVLAGPDTPATLRVYPVSGPVVSLQVPRQCVSRGWLEAETEWECETCGTPLRTKDAGLFCLGCIEEKD